MRNSRILCSVCSNPPKDNQLKSFCNTHPRFLVCNECWDSNKGRQCQQCKKVKMPQSGTSKQQIIKPFPNQDGNQNSYNAYHFSKGRSGFPYLAQLEIEKNQAITERINKDLEYKQLKENFDQMTKKIQEHKQSILNQFKLQQQQQIEEQKQRMQREYRSREAVMNQEVDQQKASLKRQEQQLLTQFRLRQSLNKLQNEKQIVKLNIERVQLLAKFKEEENQWNRLLQQQKNNLQALSERYKRQMIEASQHQKRQKQQYIENIERQKRKALDSAEAEKRRACNEYEQKIVKLTAELTAKVSDTEEKTRVHEQFLQKQKQNLQNQKEQLQEKNRGLLAQIQQYNQKFKQQNMQLSKISDKQTEISKLIIEKSRLRDNLVQKQNSLNHLNASINSISNHMQILTNSIGRTFNEAGNNFQVFSPQRAKLLKVLIDQYNQLQKFAINKEVNAILHNNQTQIDDFALKESGRMRKMLKEVNIKDWIQNHAGRLKYIERFRSRLQLFKQINNKAIQQEAENQIAPAFKDVLIEYLDMFKDRLVRLNYEPIKTELIDQIHFFQETKQRLPAQFQQRGLMREIQNNIDQFVQWLKDRIQFLNNRNLEPQPQQQLLRIEQTKHILKLIQNGAQRPNFQSRMQKSFESNYEIIYQSCLVGVKDKQLQLEEKFRQLTVSRNYRQGYNMEIVFRRYKSLHELIDKADINFHSLLFGQLYMRYANFLRILKEQKVGLSIILISNDKINVEGLKLEMESISFDEQIRLRFIYRLIKVLLNRVSLVQMMGVNEQLKLKEIQMMEQYIQESSKIKQIEQLNSIDEIGVLQRLIGEKMKLVSLYLNQNYSEIYSKFVNFDNISRTKEKCQQQAQVQRFLSTFPVIHAGFNESIYSKLHINRAQTIHSYFYEYLNGVADKSQAKVVQIADNQEETLKNEHINLYANIYDNLDEEKQLKIQTKLKNTINSQISRLQFKQSKGLTTPDQQQIKIMHQIKQLPQRYITIFRKQIDNRRKLLSEQKLSIIEKEKKRLTPNNLQTLRSLYSNYEIERSRNNQQWKKYAEILQSFIEQSYRQSIGNASKQLLFLRNLYSLDKGAHCEMIEYMKAKEFGIYFLHIGVTSNQRLMNLLQRVQSIQNYNYGYIVSTRQEINHILQLGMVLQENNAESLLQQSEKSEFRKIISAGKQKIIENVQQLQKIKKIHILEEGVDRKRVQELFIGLIKIQIYKKILKPISQENQLQELFSIEDNVIQMVNSEMDEGVKWINNFKFGISAESIQQQLKKGLKDTSFIFTRFKQIQQLERHFSDYTRQGYLNKVHFKHANISQIANKLQSTWQKQYFRVKNDINRQLHHKNLSANIAAIMKSIQIQKQFVESNSITCFKFLLEERYNLDIQGISRLKQQQDRLQSSFLRLAEKRQLFLNGAQNMLRQGQQRKKQEREKIVTKYSTLMNEVRNSFHEMVSQEARQQRINSQIQTLRNQQNTELHNIVEEESKILQDKKARHLVNIETSILNILESLSIVDKISHIFGPLVQQRAQLLLNKVRKDVESFDKGLIEQIRKHAASMKFNNQILNILRQDWIPNNQNEKQPIKDIQQYMRKVGSIGENQTHLKKACKQFIQQFQRSKKTMGLEYSEKAILQMIKGTKSDIKLLSPPVILARIHCVFQMILMRQSIEKNDLKLPSSEELVTILLLLNAHQNSSLINNTIADVTSTNSSFKITAYCSIYLTLKGYNVFCGNSSVTISKKIRQQYQQIFCYFDVENVITYGQYQSAYKYFLNDGQNLQLELIVKKMIIKSKLSSLQQKFISNITKKIQQKKQSTVFIMSEVEQFCDMSIQGCFSPIVRVDITQIHRIFELIWKRRSSQTLKDDIFKSAEVNLLKQRYSELWRLLVNHIQAMINSARKFKQLEQIKMGEMQLQSGIKWKRTEEGFYFNVFSATSKYEKGLISQQAYRKVLFIPVKIGQLPYLDIPSFFCKILGISQGSSKLPPFHSKILKQKYLIRKIYQISNFEDPYQTKDIAFKSVNEEQFHEQIIDKMLALKSSGKSVAVFFEREEEIDKLYCFKEKIASQLPNICKLNQNTPFKNTIISIEKLYRQSSIVLMNSQMLKTLLSLLPQQAPTIDLCIIFASIPKNITQMNYLRAIQKRNIQVELIVSQQQLLKKGISMQNNRNFYPNLQLFWSKSLELLKQNESLKMRVSKQKIQNSMKILGYVQNDMNKFIDAITKINLIELDNQNNKLIIAIQASPLMLKALSTLIKLLKDEILHGVHFTVKILVFRNYHCKYDTMFQSSNFSRTFDYLKTYIESIRLEEYYQQSCYEGLLYQIGKICEYEKIKSLIIIGEGLGNSKNDMSRLRSKFYGEKYWASKLPFYENLQAYGKSLLQNNFSINFLEIVNSQSTDEGEKEDTVKSIRLLVEQSCGEYKKMSSTGFDDVFKVRSLKQMISSCVASRRE